MPTYPTPTAIDLAVNWQVGTIDIVATDRADTVVTVTPTTQKASDRKYAEETSIVFDGQRLTVSGAKPRLAWIGPGANESADLRVELPIGSRFTAEVAMGGVRTTGVLGATRIKASMGTVDLETTGDLWLRAGHGNAAVGTAAGSIEITADHGQIRVGTVAGDATLKSSHGSLFIGECGGDLDAKLSYGDLDVTKALASVIAKTAYGSINLHEISSGSVQLESGYGQVTIGVREGVPAWLDLTSKRGHVRNELEGGHAPDASEQTVAVRAHVQGGDILIRRAR
jgi:hypothetical protein